MTWYEIILLIISVSALALLAWRYLLKFPLVARVDADNLPAAKQHQTKKNILDQRLRRLLSNKTVNIRQRVKSIFQLGRNLLTGLYHDLLDKERELKAKRMQARTVTAVGQNSLEERIKNLIDEAQKLYKQDNLVEAEKRYLEIISLDPKNVPAFEGLGDLYLQQRKYQEARETFDYLLRLTNAEGYFYDKLGQVAKAQGRLQEAEAQFIKSVELNSQNAGYLSDLAEVYRLEGEYDKTAGYLKQALAIEPNNPKYLDALLEISIIRKDKGAASEVLLRFMEANPDNQKISGFKQKIEDM